MTDHSASRRIDVLQEQAPHLIAATPTPINATALTDLRELLIEASADGGPTPIADALSRWSDLWPWQERRPIERMLAGFLLEIIAGMR